MKTIAQSVATLSGLAVILAFAGVRSAEKQAPTPILVAPAKPADLHARKKLLPWREVLESVAPDGTEPTVDFPPEMWFRNTNSRRGGDGMCVFTSWEFSATQERRGRGGRTLQPRAYRAVVSTRIPEPCR